MHDATHVLASANEMRELCTRAGVHTKKLYHIGQRIPFWVRAILPALNFDLEEEAWTLGPEGQITLVLPRPLHMTYTKAKGPGGVEFQREAPPPLEAAICLCSTPVACGMRTNEGMSGEVPDVPVGGWGQEREMGSEEEGKREGVGRRENKAGRAACSMGHATRDMLAPRCHADAAVVSVLFAAARWRSKCRCSLSSV